MHREKFHVSVATTCAGDGAVPPRRLLALLACADAPLEGESDAVTHSHRFDQILVYLHGFPDMAVHPSRLDMASRLPFKIAEAWLEQGMKESQAFGFVAFNFGGVPGSDDDDSLAFHDKTISKEVEDAIAVCGYVRQTLLRSTSGRIHIVGISTGAIIGSLLREKRVADTIAVIAGLADLQKGIRYDFSDQQMQQFATSGACWKEFYFPDGCALPKTAIVSLDGVNEATTEELIGTAVVPRKVYLRLQRQYVDECLAGVALDIKRAVACAEASEAAGVQHAPCPFLVIHGDADTNVPFADGEELFAAAAEPKRFLAIAKANHLLTNSKHLKKALQAILRHTQNL